jgi:aminopeptidase N
MGIEMGIEGRNHERCACGSALSSYRADASERFVLRGTERVYERPRPFRVRHVALEIAVDHPRGSLTATAELRFERVDGEADELCLDAVGFDIASVQLRARRVKRGARAAKRYRAASYSYDGSQLRVEVSPVVREAELRVRYRATPRRGMYFLGPDEQVPDRPEQIWTQCQDEDARHIFPCHDKPHERQTFELKARVPAGWFVLSNGDLRSSRAAQARGEFHYRMRQSIPSYLFTFVAGRFAKVSARHGQLPVDYFVEPGRESDAKRSFGNTPKMIALFEKRTGVAYPWSKYAQIVVRDFIFGGMENTGATTMYEHILLDEQAALDVSSDDLIAHELAHQWFGDLVTCRDWSHGWLNEGFATFFEHVWREHHLGRDEYERGVRIDLRAYLSEAAGRYRRPVVCQDYKAPIDVFDRHLYEKGGLTLHALRLELGEQVFWRGVRGYLERHAHGEVETRDLMRAMEEVSGRSLEQFFEQLLYRADHASLDVKVAYEKGLLTVHVQQKLASDARPFAFDLELELAPANERLRSVTRRVDQREHTFAFAMDERPRFVVVDPRVRVIGRVTVDAPADMLREQLASAATGRGRTMAAERLGRHDDPVSIDALATALRSGRNFWGVRSAAALALGNIRSSAAFEVLRGAVRVRHPKVRRAVVQALGHFRNDDAAKLLARVAQRDDSVLVTSSAARALGATRRDDAFESLVELLERSSWAEVVRIGAIDGLAKLRDDRGAKLVAERTAYGTPLRARRAAIAALPKLSMGRKTREQLEELLEDGDPHVRVAVADALGELADSKARPALNRQLSRDLDGRVRRRIREVLRDLGGRGRRDVRELREQLEALQREHAELKARLSKVEERLPKSRQRKRRK